MDDSHIDEMIREVTKPEGGENEAARAAARGRLLAAAQSDRGAVRRFLRPGRRGLALIAALLVVPAGVAVAAELGRDDDLLVAAEDCPELFGVVAERGLSAEGLVLATCPVGAEVDQTLNLLEALERRRAALESGELESGGGTSREEAIGFVGRSEDGEPLYLERISGDSGSTGP